METNWQTVNPILIKAESDTLSGSDVSSLQSVASQCPHTGGRIVFTARALLTAYYKRPMEYPNDCPVTTGGGERVQNATGIANTASKQQNINLYPNPNNGNMMVDYTISSDATMEIVDVTGNIIGQYVLSALNKNIEIHNNNLANGVYLYRITNANGILQTGRVVIMK